MNQKKPKIGLETSTKRGFTLIELLMVLTIIMIMTLLAMANFTYVQQQARLDFAADTLVSALREAQVLAKSGRVSNNVEGVGVLQCQAVKIVSGTEDGNGLYMGQSNYIGLPKDALSGDQVDTCEQLGENQWRKIDVFDGQTVILGDGSIQTFYFKPPFGQIYEELLGVLGKAKSQKVHFLIDNATNPAANPADVRKVEFDLATGVVKRVLPQSS